MYKVIINNSTYELTEKKSKFIANLIYVESKEEAELKIKEIRKKYHDARHNCYAYRILENKNEIYEKSSDDGEPSGTAGSPMLNLLQSNNLVNCVVIVTRYFGGILLGTGGLVRCYSNSTKEAINKADKSNMEFGTEFEIKIDYSEYKNLQYYAQKNKIEIINVEYNEEVICHIIISNDLEEQFLKDIKDKKLMTKEITQVSEKLKKI